MNIHWLQHVAFEGLGSIEEWAIENGHNLDCTRLYAGESLPGQLSFDLLIVMGGPMGIYDELEHPWLKAEKNFIKNVIDSDIATLGICLGAQLIADVLGARVVSNREKEIGWFHINRAQECPQELEAILPERLKVFHWHGDMFDIPSKGIPLYSSAICENQAFLYGNNVIGLQFHLETTPLSRKLLIENCSDELVTAPWVQTAEQMLATDDYFEEINKVMGLILAFLSDSV